MSNLALLASLARGDEPTSDKAVEAAPAPLSVDEDSILEDVMDEFRNAPTSKDALRSLRALLAKLK